MLEAIIKRLKHDKRGISNVIVVMLSLVLIVIIVANVILWSYQMNQLDLERMQEAINISNATRITSSTWFTAQEEFSILNGSKISGSYTDTMVMDTVPEIFREEFPFSYHNPSAYILGGSTTLFSGSITDLKTDDNVYMQFKSYPSAFSDVLETFGNTAGGTSYRNVENVIVGSLFTSTKDGEAQSITIYVRITASSKRMRCAIYLHSNLSLVSQTEERMIPAGTAWVTFNFLTPKPIIRAGTEYLLVAWAEQGSGNAYLYRTSGTANQGHYVNLPYEENFPNTLPNLYHEARAYCIYCTFKPATEETVEIEFTGISNTQSWMDLTWNLDSCFTADEVTAVFQLYNYQSGEYAKSGDGYMNATIGTTDITMKQIITNNPTYFRDADGNWKLKVTGKKATETAFNFKADWIEFQVTLSSVYRLEIINYFTIDLSSYPLDHVYGFEILVRYNVSETSERWFIKAYNWASASFSDLNFNDTDGSQPILNEWNDYMIGITENWMQYVNSNGTIKLKFYDEGLSENQTVVYLDFLGVRAIIDGTRFSLRNSGALTAHVVSVWVINATHHRRYDVNLFINSGESTAYIRADIPLPDGNFIVKIVTERGNIAVFTSG